MTDERYQVGPDTRVTLTYRVLDAEGELVDASEKPVEIIFGHGQLLPAVEQAIEGLGPGDDRTLSLRPEQAYGQRDPTALIEVDAADFPEDVAPGDRFEAETDTGDLVVLRVVEVTPEAAVVDTNHPLAGQTVRFELAIVGVRPATEAEIAEAAAALERRQTPMDAGDPALVPLQRLLAGGRRRYESIGD